MAREDFEGELPRCVDEIRLGVEHKSTLQYDASAVTREHLIEFTDGVRVDDFEGERARSLGSTVQRKPN